MIRIDDRVGEGVIPHLLYLGVYGMPKDEAKKIIDSIINEMDSCDLDEDVEYFVERYVYLNNIQRANRKKFKFFNPSSIPSE